VYALGKVAGPLASCTPDPHRTRWGKPHFVGQMWIWAMYRQLLVTQWQDPGMGFPPPAATGRGRRGGHEVVPKCPVPENAVRSRSRRSKLS
jgi:hypothetical protein